MSNQPEYPDEYPWPTARDSRPDEWATMTTTEKHERADLLVAISDARRHPAARPKLTLAQEQARYWKRLAEKETSE